MGYLQDAPQEVRPMIAILRDMGQYRYDPADVFRDWIDYAVGCFLVDGDQALAERLRKQYGKDYDRLYALLGAWFEVLDRQVADDGRSWFDALGMVYEYLASNSKRQWLGQFFTPPEICDLMTQLNISAGKPETGKTVNDPAAGSGRLLLSYNSHAPGNFMYGEDLDPVCAKMSAMNMAVHGCQGQVVCHDSIAMDNWRFAYQVNLFHATGGPAVPHLVPIVKEQCRTWQHWQHRLAEYEAGLTAVPPEPIAKTVPQRSQLSLF